MAGSRAKQLLLRRGERAAQLQICAVPVLALLLWEDNLQGLKDELDPAVFFDGQQSDDFRAGGDDDRNQRSGSRFHV